MIQTEIVGRMRTVRDDFHARGLTPDASDLVLQACTEVLGRDVCETSLQNKAFKEEIRNHAVFLLHEAGYCACGTKYPENPRCPCCSLVRKI